MRSKKLTERPEFFTLTPDFHPLKKGLVFAGLGLTHKSTRYHDSSPRNNVGTLTNMDPATDWVWDSTLNRFVLDFDSSDDEVQIGRNIVGVPSQMAFSVWTYKPTDTASRWIVGTWKDGATIEGFAFGAYAGTTIRLYSGSATNRWTGNTTDFVANQWQHWAANYVAGGSPRWTVYRNGVPLSSSADTSADIASGPTKMLIGGEPFETSWSDWLGKISDCMFYVDRNLSASEISALADPSNVMLSGLILPPRPRIWAVSGGAPPAETRRNLIIGGGVA